jgi:hypothetical protein
MDNLTKIREDGLPNIESKGIAVPDSPFGTVEYVGTLLFEEYSTTVVYSDEDKNPVIREWADCSNDGLTDRFFFYKTSKLALLQFIQGTSSNKDFVLDAVNNAYHFVDIRDKATISSFLIFKDKFPKEYLSEVDYRFSDADGVDLEKIKSYFELEAILESKIDARVIDVADKSMYETFNLHLKEGNGIGFGIANTEILGHTLLNFNALYENATLDYFLGSHRSDRQSAKRKQVQHLTSTEVYYNIAASYSLLIRPASAQYDVFDENRSSSEIVAGKIFTLFENAKNIDDLASKFIDYSPYLIESFKIFLKEVQSTRVNLGFGWYNPNSHILFKENVDYKLSHSILTNLESLSTQNSEVITTVGFFEVIHCNTSYFGFVSLDNRYFTGYATIKESIRLLNFVDEYGITLVQNTIGISGRDEPKVENRIISFHKRDNRRSVEISPNG